MSFKVLHTGDVHLGDLSGPTKDGENLRRLDTLRCMSDIVQKAEIVTPDITVIAGDLFNRSRVWADTALDDVNDAISGFLRPLCQHSHAVVLLFGTENHDNPRAFDVIKKATGDLKNLHIYTQPTVDTISTPAGSIQILAVPGFDRGRLRTFFPGADKEAENQNATALVNQLVLGLATQLDPNLPSILTAHYTVTGCTTESGQSFLAGQDVVISTDTIDGANVSLGCFGHIHNPQKLLCNTPAYYCGSPNQLTFNDEGIQHGFWIHTISDDSVTSTFHGTPERKHYTLRLNAQEITDFLNSGKALFPIEVKGAVVRVRYNCSAEQDKALNRAELQKAIMQAGAFYVAEILPEEIVALDAVDQLTEHDGPAEALERWLDLNEVPFETSTRLQELARPILAKADDGRNSSKHTGAFVPISITVRNYRSYTDATFDFAPVRMAMVNGSNGVGKSSLFMDALADCLFEQSRQEDIGGWVRDGTKSGSITFCFEVGGTTYQVIRTRLRSGKGTLALQQKGEDGEWVDAGDTTMKLTQQKIIRLLGMDCNTFCSIALIRQDAYG
ncbi:MAG: AAA family ATPase, partial [Oscillospiraceae bacterium]|nr:AAA family ATPase [Oscillospiraceae bacterium]